MPYPGPMALLGREFIAVPDDRKGQIVFKHPDNNIRKYTRAIVDAGAVGDALAAALARAGFGVTVGG